MYKLIYNKLHYSSQPVNYTTSCGDYTPIITRERKVILIPEPIDDKELKELVDSLLINENITELVDLIKI